MSPAPAVVELGTEELVRPAYGEASLADLLPGIGVHLGVPGCDANALDLPPAERYVVVLVDGLGWHLVRRAIREVPYFSGLLGDATALTASVPSTTATSLGSFGTGLPPGQHGIVGYTSRVPGGGALLNALTWESTLRPEVYQPKPTFLERAEQAGVAVTTVALPRFAASGLTRAVLRGGDFVDAAAGGSAAARTASIRAAALREQRSLVYVYERRLDHLGHGRGCGSTAWLDELAEVDAFCEQLRDALPEEVALLITGDHGMVDVPAGHQIIAEDEPGLLTGVSALAGEGRFRQLYVDHDRPAAVASRWRRRLGDRAWVRLRDEAFDDGWFGPVDPGIADRYGAVLVAMRDDWAVMTRTVPRELSLVGMHGSLTAAEMLVPLFVD